MKYTCDCCGKEHDEWPALTYDAPAYYNNLSQSDKRSMGMLDSDFCTITHPDRTDKFIRCTLFQKVVDDCQILDYGLWVSLSEKSFVDYRDNFSNENYETKYFGWLSSVLPEYVFTESIPTTVFTKSGNQRPEIAPHKGFYHPFVSDYYNGITKAEAEKRIITMLEDANSQQQTQNSSHPWWKR